MVNWQWPTVCVETRFGMSTPTHGLASTAVCPRGPSPRSCKKGSRLLTATRGHGGHLCQLHTTGCGAGDPGALLVSLSDTVTLHTPTRNPAEPSGSNSSEIPALVWAHAHACRPAPPYTVRPLIRDKFTTFTKKRKSFQSVYLIWLKFIWE